MTDDDPTELVPQVPRLTRRDRRIERDRHRRSRLQFGWLAYSVAVFLIIAGAATLAASAGR
jgi:hypothetical protein